jgi:hypothetical protein
MKLISIILIISFSLMIFQCSPKISRIGYPESNAAKNSNCEVLIKENAQIDEIIGLVIGTIKIGDTGFSSNCSEEDVIKILKEEACVLGAEIINIKEVERPDLSSTCFRCTADFIKLNESINLSDLKSSDNYSEEKIDKRVKEDSNTQLLLNIGGFAIGFAVTYFLFSGK